MPDSIQIPTICIFCETPIEREQRPSVRLNKRDEVHLECYLKADRATVLKGRGFEPHRKCRIITHVSR